MSLELDVGRYVAWMRNPSISHLYCFVSPLHFTVNLLTHKAIAISY